MRIAQPSSSALDCRLKVRSHARCLAGLIAGMSLVLGGCATGFREYVHNGFKVGPNYSRPEAAVADQWIDFQDDRIQSDQESRWDWWRIFNDPKLDALIQTAHNQNLTLREAGFRIYEARALRAIAIGNLLPQQQTAYGAYNRQMLSLGAGLQAGGGAGFPGIKRYFGVWNLGTQFAWELDFWGLYRRSIESADAQLDASVESYDDVLTILIGDVASTYVDIRTFEQRIVYAAANVVTQGRSLELAEARLAGGAVSRLDVTQAVTNLGQTESAIPDLQRQLQQAQNRLCVLLGIPPQEISALLDGPQGIPLAPPQVVLGVPADLLRRRPDIRRAEREVAAQSARIGIAESELYPAFTINGNIFVRATQFQNVFQSNSVGGNIGPSFNWNVLNYGRIRNAVVAEEARLMQEITQYQNIVLNANREAEDAIVGFLRAQEQANSLRKAADAAQESRDLVDELYRGGKADFGRVFVAELVLAQQQDALAVAQGAISRNLVEVFRSLGGGWELRFAMDSDGLIPMAEEVPAPPTPANDEPAVPPPANEPPPVNS